VKTKITREFIVYQLKCLKDMICWGVVAGKGTGSHIVLDFGDKIARRHVLSNPHLSCDQNMFEGSYSLFIKCAWRLQNQREVLCSSTSSNKKGGRMQMGLTELVGSNVIGIYICPQTYDVKLTFSNNLRLYIFCDMANSVDNDDNYSLFTPSDIYTIPSGLRHLKHESRFPKV